MAKKKIKEYEKEFKSICKKSKRTKLNTDLFKLHSKVMNLKLKLDELTLNLTEASTKFRAHLQKKGACDRLNQKQIDLGLKNDLPDFVRGYDRVKNILSGRLNTAKNLLDYFVKKYGTSDEINELSEKLIHECNCMKDRLENKPNQNLVKILNELQGLKNNVESFKNVRQWGEHLSKFQHNMQLFLENLDKINKISDLCEKDKGLVKDIVVLSRAYFERFFVIAPKDFNNRNNLEKMFARTIRYSQLYATFKTRNMLARFLSNSFKLIEMISKELDKLK